MKMKVLSVNGITKTGKTTTVENIIRELKKRGYTVGSVKEIHYEEFRIDTEGTNTDRHKKAGSELVTARGMYETDVLYQGMLPMDQILTFYNHDYVILEGVNDINAPKIITAHNTEEIDRLIDYKTLMISGVISNELTGEGNPAEYKGIPVINSIGDIGSMVDMLEAKVPHLLPDFDSSCCSACGYDCHTLLQKIIAGEMKRGDCRIDEGNITLLINGKEITMVPFVQNILRNAVLGVVKELSGYQEGASLKITM